MTVAVRARPTRERVWAKTGAVQVLAGLIPLVLVLSLWQLLGPVNSFSFPSPSTWVEALVRLANGGLLWPALVSTLITYTTGLAASIVIGTVVGWLIGSSPAVNRTLSPTLDFFRAMPTPALIPVVMVLLGVTLGMTVVLMVLTIVWPILLNTASARANIPAVRLEMARTLGIGRFERARKIVFPSLVPDIVTGVRVAASVGFITTLAVEILGSGTGLGRLLIARQQTFDAAAVWGLLALVGFLGLVVNAAVEAVDSRVKRLWAQ